MSQIESGVRGILSRPRVYNFFQDLVGAERMRRELVARFVRAQAGDRVLDLGCGTAKILDCLPEVEYFGFDISRRYIEAARLRYGSRGNFFCQEWKQDSLDPLSKFDIVLAIGLLHHMDDFDAKAFLRMAHEVLRPRGRLISIDPVLDPGASLISRFLVRRDRGQNVRSATGYRELVQECYSDVHGEIHQLLRIPYTQYVMECTA